MKCKKEYIQNLKIKLIPCGCDCGEMIPNYDKYGRPRRFKAGHFFTMPINLGRKLTEEHKKRIGRSGEKNWNYRGGRSLHSGGYMRLNLQNGKKDPRVLEHRIIYEKHYKCCLLSWIQIHHKNHNKKDNRPENLEPLTAKQHAQKHRKDMSDRLCIVCDSGNTLIYKGRPVWRRHPVTKQKWVCNKCADRIRWRVKVGTYQRLGDKE